jgi:hypothetical protein
MEYSRRIVGLCLQELESCFLRLELVDLWSELRLTGCICNIRRSEHSFEIDVDQIRPYWTLLNDIPGNFINKFFYWHHYTPCSLLYSNIISAISIHVCFGYIHIYQPCSPFIPTWPFLLITPIDSTYVITYCRSVSKGIVWTLAKPYAISFTLLAKKARGTNQWHLPLILP